LNQTKKPGKIRTMVSKSAASNPLKYVDWLGIESTRPERARSFGENFWPAANEYYSPLNPIFLSQRLRQFHRRPHWLIRDGAKPLSEFFRRNPKPLGLQTRLYIEDSLVKAAPEAWHSHLGTYRMVSLPSIRVKITKTIFCGIALPEYHSAFEWPSKRLRQWALTKNYFYLPAQPLKGDPQGVDLLNYVSLLHSRLGRQLIPLSWAQIHLSGSFAGYELVDLSGKQLMADSYFAHVLLAKGAYLRAKPYSNDGHSRLVELSPYHGVVLRAFTATG
jgi:hypothetical protein